MVSGDVLELAPLDGVRQRLRDLQRFVQEVMVAGVDYGLAPGSTDKFVLLKPGAEKLCEVYGLAPTVEVLHREVEWATGVISYEVRVRLVERRSGALVAEGVGAASTMEGRHRWRWVWPRELPQGTDLGALVSRETRSGDRQYRVQNDDLASLQNTVLKMAKKRALVDAVLSATRSSAMFTQDLEELETPERPARAVSRDTERGPRPAKAARPADGGSAPASAARRSDNGASPPAPAPAANAPASPAPPPPLPPETAPEDARPSAAVSDGPAAAATADYTAISSWYERDGWLVVDAVDARGLSVSVCARDPERAARLATVTEGCRLRVRGRVRPKARPEPGTPAALLVAEAVEVLV